MSTPDAPPLAMKIKIGSYSFTLDAEGLRAVARLATAAAVELEAGRPIADARAWARALPVDTAQPAPEPS